MKLETVFSRCKSRAKIELPSTVSHFKTIKQDNIEYLVSTHPEYKNFKIRRFPQNHPRTPKIEILETPTNIKNLIRILEAVNNCRGGKEGAILINGETGCGKNTLIYYIANLLGQDVRVVSCSEDMEENELAEDIWIVKDGYGNPKMTITPSPTAQGLREGSIIVWDEANKLKPGVIKKANPIVQDKRILAFKGKELYEASEGMVIVLTGNLGERYAVDKFSSEFKNRLEVIDIDYLPPEEEKQWLLWRRMNYSPGKPASGEEIDLIHNLVGAARQIRKFYLGEVEKENGKVEYFEKGSLISVVLSTASLEQIVEHIAHFPEDIHRIGDIIKRYYNYLEEDEDIIRNIEAILEPRGLVKSDKSLFYFKSVAIKNDNQSKHLSFRYKYKNNEQEIKIEIHAHAPDKIEDVPYNYAVDLTTTNALLLCDALKDVSLGRHLQFVGEQGTGKDRIGSFISYLIQGQIRSYGVSENTDRSDLLSYRAIGMSKPGEMTEEKASLPQLMMGDGKRGFIGIYQEINSARPKVLGVFNNTLRFGFTELPDTSTVVANEGWLIITTRNPYRSGYKGIKRLSLEFEQRFSTHWFGDLPRDEKIEIIKGDINRHKSIYPLDNYHLLTEQFIGKVTDLEVTLREKYPEALPDPVSLRNAKRLCKHISLYPYNFFDKNRYYQIIDEHFYFEDREHKKIVKQVAKDIFEDLPEVIDFKIRTGNTHLDELLKEIIKEKDELIVLSRLDEIEFMVRLTLKGDLHLLKNIEHCLDYIKGIKRNPEIDKSIEKIIHKLNKREASVVKEPVVLRKRVDFDETIFDETIPFVRKLSQSIEKRFYMANRLRQALKIVQLAGQNILLIDSRMIEKKIVPIDFFQGRDLSYKKLFNFLILDEFLSSYLETEVNRSIAYKISLNAGKIKLASTCQNVSQSGLSFVDVGKYGFEGYHLSNKQLEIFLEKIVGSLDVSYSYWLFFKEKVIPEISYKDEIIFLYTLLFTVQDDLILEEIEKIIRDGIYDSPKISDSKDTLIPVFQPIDVTEDSMLKELLRAGQSEAKNISVKWFFVADEVLKEEGFEVRYLWKKNEIDVWIRKKDREKLNDRGFVESIICKIRKIVLEIIETITKSITKQDLNDNLERLTYFTIDNNVLYAGSAYNNSIFIYRLTDQKYMGAITNEVLNNRLNYPQSLAIHEHILYINNRVSPLILRYHLKADRYLEAITIKELKSPTALRIRNHILYVSCSEQKSIFMYDLLKKEYSGAISIRDLKGATGLDIAGDILYISSRWDHLILKHDLKTGRRIGAITNEDLNNNLREPTDLIIHDSKIYVSSFLRGSVLVYCLITHEYLGSIIASEPTCLFVHNDILYISSDKNDVIYRRLLPGDLVDTGLKKSLMPRKYLKLHYPQFINH
ncbi:MAG: AAA family ATPase [Deltaproteobacteria bacterium]|nr:AAA family ATPase [Deltaproteobacteria bacterium]